MLKSESGSITVFTLTAMLFFVIVLMGVFVSTNNTKKFQKIADTSLIDMYQKDVNLVNEIYNEKEKEYSKSNNYSEIGTIKWQNKDIVINSDNSVQANASLKISNNNISNCKYIINNTKRNIGINSSDWEEDKAYEITFGNEEFISGTISTNIEYEKIYFIHVLITYNSGKKVEIVSNALNVNTY